MRSPLAYPLTRSVDADAGGAADLQTDIMRFMAILALCLVAIFTLVQSMPLAPAPATIPAITNAAPAPLPVETLAIEKPPQAAPGTAAPPARVQITRPAWTPKFVSQAPAAVPEAAASDSDAKSFSLRFESDAALTRLVAAGEVGFYAYADKRTRRMTIGNDRIGFWDASIPNAFHEMEAATVPPAVIDALARSGGDPDGVQWGVTLPARMTDNLDALMHEHDGGAVLIGADGNLRLEAR